MTFVLNVSAAIKIMMHKSKKDLFNSVYKKGTWIIAPDLFIAEITNVLWKYQKGGVLSDDDCIQYVKEGFDMVDDFYDSKDLWKEALAKDKKNHVIYDMYYAVLARRNDATIITNDSPLTTFCRKLNIEVCH
jgi:predicted nucleic acid-binding protein